MVPLAGAHLSVQSTCIMPHHACPNSAGACVHDSGAGVTQGIAGPVQAECRAHSLQGPGTGQKNSGLGRPAALRSAPVLPVRTCPVPESPSCLLFP